jgi:hypothetical protein
MTAKILKDLLYTAAKCDSSYGLVIYPRGVCTSPETLGYADLLRLAQLHSHQLARIVGFSARCIVLIHLNDHLANIIWLWAAIFANAIPTMSTLFSNLPEQREKQIHGITKLFKNPIWSTRNSLLPFSAKGKLRIYIPLKNCTDQMVEPWMSK